MTKLDSMYMLKLQALAELYYKGWLWGTYSLDFDVPTVQISLFLDMLDSKHNKTNVQAYFWHFFSFGGDLRNQNNVNFKEPPKKFDEFFFVSKTTFW